MKKAVKITVKGNVQGVFYRNYVKEHAERLELFGFVRNIEEGNVELFVEGDIEKVDEMFELCKKGPKHAVIDSTEMAETSFQDFKDFKILHI
jgi:acylphosphatase